MKHSDLFSLKYDGRAERDLKEKDPKLYDRYLQEIERFAKYLQEKFPKVKDVYFVEVAKRGFEIAYKRSKDSATRDNILHMFEKFEGSDSFIGYLKAIKLGRYLTKKLTLTYINPIRRDKDGKGEKVRPQEELLDAPVKTIVVDAGQLLGLIEDAIVKHINLEGLIQTKTTNDSKPTLFGTNNSSDDRFYAQYAKTQCKEMREFLNSSSCGEKVKKDICICVLEYYRMIETYNEYVSQKEMEAKFTNKLIDVDSRELWVSRKFSSLIRLP